MVTDPAAQTREPASDPAFEKFGTDATIKNSEGNPETQALTLTTTADDQASSIPIIAITADDQASSIPIIAITADSETTTSAAVASGIINILQAHFYSYKIG
jgi:hypothetical protein